MRLIEREDAGFVVELERFRGPLDLLLHLIREQDIDVFDIPIARITQQFLEAIDGVAELGLERAGEFLEMAATLVRIKLQMLLPRRKDDTGQWIDPRAELVRRLLEYEHFREAAIRLEESEADRCRHYGKGYVPPRPKAVRVQALTVAWADVWAAVLELDTRAKPPAEHRLPTRIVSMEEKIGLIHSSLGRHARVEFRQLVEPFADRLHVVVTLLAGLELSKQRVVSMRQRELFAPLWLYRGIGEGSDADHTDR